MQTAAQCLRHALECEAQAKACRDPVNRGMLLDTSAVWRRLADDTDRHLRMTVRAYVKSVEDLPG